MLCNVNICVSGELQLGARVRAECQPPELHPPPSPRDRESLPPEAGAGIYIRKCPNDVYLCECSLLPPETGVGRTKLIKRKGQMLSPGMITSLSLEIQLTILKTAHFVETDRKQKKC